jgi:hypothetical protein
MSEFEFSVGEKVNAAGESEGWMVYLPHQCASWDIVGDDGYDGLEHSAAVARMELFVAEAEQALTALRERRAIGLLVERDDS